MPLRQAGLKDEVVKRSLFFEEGSPYPGESTVLPAVLPRMAQQKAEVAVAARIASHSPPR